MLRKANQKRSLDDIVIQKGEFDWRSLFNDEGLALTKALDEFDDVEDRRAAAAAAREENSLLGADANDFEEGEARASAVKDAGATVDVASAQARDDVDDAMDVDVEGGDGGEDEEGGTIADYMVNFVESNYDF